MERLQKVRWAVYTRARAARAWVSRWVGPGFPPRGQVGGRWCHLVAARRAPPRGPRGLGSLLCPSPPSFGRSCAFGAACPRPSPARTFPRPPSHSPQQPLTSPGSVSSSRGSSVPGSPSSIVVSLPPPPRAPSGWEEGGVGHTRSWAASLRHPPRGPATASGENEPPNPEVSSFPFSWSRPVSLYPGDFLNP